MEYKINCSEEQVLRNVLEPYFRHFFESIISNYIKKFAEEVDVCNISFNELGIDIEEIELFLQKISLYGFHYNFQDLKSYKNFNELFAEMVIETFSNTIKFKKAG